MVKRKMTGTKSVRRTATARRMIKKAGPSKPSYEEISKTAYYLFEKRNCAHGHDQDDWLEAEKMLSGRN